MKRCKLCGAWIVIRQQTQQHKIVSWCPSGCWKRTIWRYEKSKP